MKKETTLSQDKANDLIDFAIVNIKTNVRNFRVQDRIEFHHQQLLMELTGQCQHKQGIKKIEPDDTTE